MKITMKKVDELIPYANNPRKNDNAVDFVASSIKNYGFKVPIIIDAKNEIIAGHTRLKAAKKLGLKEVPCIIANDLTPAQVKAFRLVDNKVAEFSEWDAEKLNIELEELSEFGKAEELHEFDFELKGIGNTDFDGILSGSEDEDQEKRHIVCPKCGFEWME